MNSSLRILGVLAWLLVISAMIPSLALAEKFAVVQPGKTLSFPRDHGAHNEFETEWWYFTGHLDSGKDRYGFELTFFRVGVEPDLEKAAKRQSMWGVQSIYFAHFAVTDEVGRSFFHTERLRRGSFDEAGASAEGLRVWLDDWSAEENSGVFELRSGSDGRKLNLQLRSETPPVLNGAQGFSRKGPDEGQASYYVSLPRLRGTGTLELPTGKPIAVDALVWMDHEWTSSDLARGDVGWDWFALQLDDGSSLMLYQIRDSSGRPSPFSSGTAVLPNGDIRHLNSEDFKLTPLANWTSAETKKTYPISWRIEVPGLALDVRSEPLVAAQELNTKGTAGMSYWEGKTTLRDLSSAKIQGAGYTELVGY